MMTCSRGCLKEEMEDRKEKREREEREGDRIRGRE